MVQFDALALGLHEAATNTMSNGRDSARSLLFLSKCNERHHFESRKHHFEALHRLPKIDAVFADLAHPSASPFSHPSSCSRSIRSTMHRSRHAL